MKKTKSNIKNELKSAGVETAYDDRDARPGEKFADADLLGIPHRVVISKKTIEKDELKKILETK